ncbi:hypothetical protein PLESTB_000021400 [Pleodorina starrii]|uniref:Uncharacterized protein n=1 Tax=Pleodorina starrii TaxID=330485 RepID=A0A9W6B8H2_9CHLO|nr:hypothetical protein PLESTB_000021400 [Pleodorina starrii]
MKGTELDDVSTGRTHACMVGQQLRVVYGSGSCRGCNGGLVAVAVALFGGWGCLGGGHDHSSEQRDPPQDGGYVRSATTFQYGPPGHYPTPPSQQRRLGWWGPPSGGGGGGYCPPPQAHQPPPGQYGGGYAGAPPPAQNYFYQSIRPTYNGGGAPTGYGDPVQTGVQPLLHQAQPPPYGNKPYAAWQRPRDPRGGNGGGGRY